MKKEREKSAYPIQEHGSHTNNIDAYKAVSVLTDPVPRGDGVNCCQYKTL